MHASTTPGEKRLDFNYVKHTKCQELGLLLHVFIKMPNFWQLFKKPVKSCVILVPGTEMQCCPDVISYLLPQCLLLTAYPLKQLKCNKIMVKESLSSSKQSNQCKKNPREWNTFPLGFIIREKFYTCIKNHRRKWGQRKQEEHSFSGNNCIFTESYSWQRIIFLDYYIE